MGRVPRGPGTAFRRQLSSPQEREARYASCVRRIWKTASVAASSALGESPLVLLDYVLRFLRVAVLLSVWRLVLAGRGPVAGMTPAAVLTYTLVAEVFAEPLAARTG